MNPVIFDVASMGAEVLQAGGMEVFTSGTYDVLASGGSEVLTSGIYNVETLSTSVSTVSTLGSDVYSTVLHSSGNGTLTKLGSSNATAFFTKAIDGLQSVIVAIGAGLGVWGVINLLEGYGNDNRATRS